MRIGKIIPSLQRLWILFALQQKFCKYENKECIFILKEN